MHFSTFIILLATLISGGLAGYSLEDDYFLGNFFDKFAFWDEEDPTHGFVVYQNRSSSEDLGLIERTSDYARWGVDSTNVTPLGRPSIRITSKKTYNYGLIVADIEHMPGGICGTWPAFWTLGPDWPKGGEIDIFEGVNDQLANLQTLHTGPNCSLSDDGGGFSGNLTHGNCDSSGSENTGCQIADYDSNTYGLGFNANGGGVYAMEWTSSCITVWFFPRGSIPTYALGVSPDPSSWGTPAAKFYGDCDFSQSFKDQAIVFDTTFCGDWADSVWSSSSCANQDVTCKSYVQNNPGAFADAYWSLNALKVYTEDYVAPTSASPYEITSTSIHYVTQPTAESIAVTDSAASGIGLSIPTKPASYAPVVGPSGVVYAQPTQSSSESSSTGYAPIVGANGAIEYDTEAGPEQGEGDWSTDNGALVFHGGKKRHVRHLGHHKRHGGGKL